MKSLTKLTEDTPSLSQRPGARARPLKQAAQRPRASRLSCCGGVWAFLAVKMSIEGFLTITNGFYPVLHPKTANREPMYACLRTKHTYLPGTVGILIWCLDHPCWYRIDLNHC